MKAGRPPSCKWKGRMSGVFGQRLPRKYSRISVCVSSVKYSVNSCFVSAPGEVGVALLKAGLGQHLHHLRFGEGLGEKNRVGKLRAHAGDQVFPEWHRLGVRIIHAKDAHAVLGPEQNDADHFIPKLLPVRAAEIQRINVLVFLRRILGVLDRAVGPFVEPLGMLGDVRMIGRTIDREIERDLHSAIADLLLQPIEILQST